MTTSDKLAAKIAQLIIRGEIDPEKIKEVEKKVGGEAGSISRTAGMGFTGVSESSRDQE